MEMPLLPLFHRLWGKAVGTGDYDKSEWVQLQKELEALLKLTPRLERLCIYDSNGALYSVWNLTPDEVELLLYKKAIHPKVPGASEHAPKYGHRKIKELLGRECDTIITQFNGGYVASNPTK